MLLYHISDRTEKPPPIGYKSLTHRQSPLQGAEKAVFNKDVQEVITILYEKQGEKFMKVELQISENLRRRKS